MKARFSLFVLMIFLIIPNLVYAEKLTPLEKLDQISNEALQMTKLHRYEDSKKILDYFSEQFLQLTSEDRNLSMDELRIITVSHNEAVEASVSTSMKYEERINRLTKFRLVMDAITTKHQPLWTEMEEPMMEVIQQINTSLENNEHEQFHFHLNTFLSLYDVIYPSLKIDLPVDVIQKLDARVNYIDHYRLEVLNNHADHDELQILGSELQTLFDEMREDEADPSLWWVMISTGSIIIMTLSYVGWKKYKADKEEQLKRKKQKN